MEAEAQVNTLASGRPRLFCHTQVPMGHLLNSLVIRARIRDNHIAKQQKATLTQSAKVSGNVINGAAASFANLKAGISVTILASRGKAAKQVDCHPSD